MSGDWKKVSRVGSPSGWHASSEGLVTICCRRTPDLMSQKSEQTVDMTRRLQTLTRRPKSKMTAALLSFGIGIAEGGARTHDLEVDLFAVIRATRSTD
jgi:hypothetical protein